MMTTYRFRMIECDGAAQDVEYVLADDAHAMRIAEHLAGDFDVELSRGDSFLGSIQRRQPSLAMAG
jgi:hypothetical protein